MSGPMGYRVSVTPAFRAFSVLVAGLDPAFARGGLLQLPERGAGLQPVDQEFAGGEAFAAMPACHADEDDALARAQASDPVDHRDAVQRPARARFVDDPADLLLGHAGIMFKGHRR